MAAAAQQHADPRQQAGQPQGRSIPPYLPGGQRPLTPEEMARQAAYYQYAGRPNLLPPNPRWHRPDAVPRQAVVVMAVVVALFGAWAAFHADGVGIGLALTGIAMVAVPLFAGDWRDIVPRLPGAALVAALWSVAAIRDAGWVVFLCSAAAFLLTPLVLAPQRRFSGTLITLMMGWFEGLAESFKWAKRGRGSKDGRDPSTVRNLWVALVTVALLLVFGGLFAAADSTFADLVAQLLPTVHPVELFLRLMLAAVLFPLTLVWIYTAVAKPDFDSERPGEHRTISRFELGVPLGALNLLFAAFIAVQLRVYLGGEDYVNETVGLTFAEYARKGFWQLSIVAVLALTVIAIAAWLAPKRAKADRWTARLLLGALCVFSMVVIASALFRMYTYVETFGLTRMRIWIFTVEIWLAVLFALVIVCCWKLRASWLPRAVLASGALALLGLAAANPDALIARHNIDHERDLDLYYLEGLSDDAVPEFADLTYEELDCVVDRPLKDDERDLMAWNLGYARALELLEDHVDGSGSCPYPSGDAYAANPVDPSTDADDADTASPDLSEPPVTEFFDTARCEELDLAAAAALYGPEAAPNGLTPGSGGTDAFLIEEPPVQAWVNCGYYGEGSVSVEASLKYFESPDAAANHMENALFAYDSSTWEIWDLDDRSSALVSDPDGLRQFMYYSVVDNFVLYAYLFDAPADAESQAVAEDLTGQLYALYGEFS
jgi:hypothetical protein